nr:immunoglobulin heavy chain junction region [Mus musculus]MBK4189376.1 immunoglobulin heavy chain junction region [Mus musculus]MBK4189377.1 immunoglobulin heavy chain junction region [Mus musculus]
CARKRGLRWYFDVW